MTDQLLIECWGGSTEVKFVNTLDESKGASGLSPGLYIEGVFLQADVINGNKRLYPKSILEKAVSQYVDQQVKTNQALGELNHPARPNVDPMQAAIIIEDMWWEGSNVMGRARVIEGDNGPGDKLAANIRAGWKPGVSSRGLGTVTSTGRGFDRVNEGYRLTVGVDVVWGPSAPDAIVVPRQISESTDLAQPDPIPSEAELNESAFNTLIGNLKAL